MKWFIRCTYAVFLIVILEIIGWILLNIFSTENDFLDNRNYLKIRAMLIAENHQQNVSKYIEVPYLTYIPNPGYEKNGIVQHNASGYRGEEIPLKKGEKFRILCLGGSTTYGSGVDNPEDTYPAQLKRILEKSGKYPQGIEVINAGAEAATSAEELIYYTMKFRYYQPDLVIIHSGGNDAMVFQNDPNYQLDYTNYRKLKFHFEPVAPGVKCLLHSRFISYLMIHFVYSPMLYSSEDMFSNEYVPSLRIARWTDESLKAKTDRHGFFYYPFYQNHRQLINNILRDGSDVINLTFGHNEKFYIQHDMGEILEGVRVNNEIIERLSGELNISWIPFSFSSIPNTAFWLDDCHLTAEGEKEKAKLISEYVLGSDR